VRHLLLLGLAALALLVGACEPYDKPRRPLPADFEVQLLGGPRLGPEQLLGKLWVIHLWNLQGQVALATGEVLGPLSVREVPSTVFVDARGQLVAAASGPRSQRFLARRTRELLDSSR
jgi:hypothetical protein